MEMRDRCVERKWLENIEIGGNLGEMSRPGVARQEVVEEWDGYRKYRDVVNSLELLSHLRISVASVSAAEGVLSLAALECRC